MSSGEKRAGCADTVGFPSGVSFCAAKRRGVRQVDREAGEAGAAVTGGWRAHLERVNALALFVGVEH